MKYIMIALISIAAGLGVSIFTYSLAKVNFVSHNNYTSTPYCNQYAMPAYPPVALKYAKYQVSAGFPVNQTWLENISPGHSFYINCSAYPRGFMTIFTKWSLYINTLLWTIVFALLVIMSTRYFSRLSVLNKQVSGRGDRT